jgi:hypothetical protein
LVPGPASEPGTSCLRNRGTNHSTIMFSHEKMLFQLLQMLPEKRNWLFDGYNYGTQISQIYENFDKLWNIDDIYGDELQMRQKMAQFIDNYHD